MRLRFKTALLLAVAAGHPVPAAEMLPPGDVRLADGPFRAAQQRDLDYLLELEPARLLAAMREAAGLETKARRYGGWETRGSGMIGHYLSACSWMSEATGHATLKQRVDAIVAEMHACQEAVGNGALYSSPWERRVWFPALERGEPRFTRVVPFYTGHKTLAGLRDAWLVAGNARAGEVLRRYADWCVEVTSRLTDEQWIELTKTEFGAPGEVFADLHLRTGEKRYAELARRFHRPATRDALADGDGSVLTGLHANTEIPVVVGYPRIARFDRDPVWRKAAVNFWQEVTRRQTFVFGGKSIWECFIPPHEHEAQLQRLCGPETCNSYNMLKLTRALWEADPEPRHLDYLEHVLHNHILGTINREGDGVFAYYTPTLPGHYRRFSRPFDAFWCCVGSGMENHARHGSYLYARDESRFLVNLYIPSTARWPERGLTLTQDSDFPASDLHRLRLDLESPRSFTLSLRLPKWAARPRVRVNGEEVEVPDAPRLELPREWRDGDLVEVHLPATLTQRSTPGEGRFRSFFHGPLLLAVPMGTAGLDDADLVAGGDEDFEQLGRKRLPLDRVPGVPGSADEARARIHHREGADYRLDSDRGEVPLIPFHRIGSQRYAVHLPVR